MLGSSKPAASLSSSLLARKGQARPAMRPGLVGLTPAPHEDLGWNDMGDEPAPARRAAPPAVGPAPAAALPEVLREREVLKAELTKPEPMVETAPAPEFVEPELEPEPQLEPEPVALAAAEPTPAALPPMAVKRIALEAGVKARSAFTLRLDNDRHLRLRLASAVTHRSAQHLVTEALDAFLKQLPEVEALACQIPSGKAGE